MKWKWLFLTAGILLLPLLLFPFEIERLFNPHTSEDVVQKVFKNRQVYNVFISSPQVNAQLLHQKPPTEFGANSYPSRLSGYTLDPPVLLTSAQLQSFRSILQNPSAYTWSRAQKDCIPDYGVLFTFHSGHQTVRIALCFECDMLGVFNGDNVNADSINTEEDFDPVNGRLLALAKSIFPNDKGIQSLAERRY